MATNTDGSQSRAGLIVRSLLAGVIAASVLAYFFAPRFFAWRELDARNPCVVPETCRAADALRQLHDPWVVIDNPVNKVIEWRLLFPLIAHYFALSPRIYLALPLIGCVLALAAAAWFSYRRLHRWREAWMAAVVFGAAPWFFVSTGWLAYFDSWLVLGLETVAFADQPVAVVAACLLTPWVDERFVIALPLCLLVRLAAFMGPQRTLRAVLADLGLIAAAVAPYPIARAVAWLLGSRAAAGAYVHETYTLMFRVPWSQFAVGLLSGYRISWGFIGAALALAGTRLGRRGGLALLAVFVVTAVMSLVMAKDISRNLMMLSPLVLLGIWKLKDLSVARFQWLLAAGMTAALLLPAAHVVWDFTSPIYYLYAELQQYRHPPH